MNEQAVRAAVKRIENEAHGMFMGTGEPCCMVPFTALDQLVEAVAMPDDAPAAGPEPAPEPEPATTATGEDVSKDRPHVT